MDLFNFATILKDRFIPEDIF
jgi:hypothetical protein